MEKREAPDAPPFGGCASGAFRLGSFSAFSLRGLANTFTFQSERLSGAGFRLVDAV